MDRSKAIQSYLKSKGLQRDARRQLEARLAPLPEPSSRVANVTERILEHVEAEAAKVLDNTTWLASSDIIESMFGKYKSFTTKGQLKEIGKLVLAIPALVSDLSTDLIREAMETIRMVDVDDWAETHLGESMLGRRRKALRPLIGDAKTA